MLKDMKTYAHLKPGQKGTRQLTDKFGVKLICVRYRYDEQRQTKIKTVEIIVDKKPCTPRLPYRDKDVVAVMVSYTETALRDRLKTAHNRWIQEEKLWRVSFGAIRGDAELEERILKE